MESGPSSMPVGTAIARSAPRRHCTPPPAHTSPNCDNTLLVPRRPHRCGRHPTVVRTMSDTLLALAQAQLAYGHHPLLDHADLNLLAGERIGLIGRNGAGKSSLL